MCHRRCTIVGLMFAIWVGIEVVPLRADVVEVWLFAGQSNMVGGGHVDHLPPGFPLVQNNVLYTQNVSSTMIEDWGPLQPRLTENQAIRRWYGPELTFGKLFTEQAPQRQLGIIKFARNGTALHSNWSPTGNTRASFYNFVDSSLASLAAQNYTPVIRGMVWVQGEGDANILANAVAYGDRLAEFVDEIRDRYHAPDMMFLFNQAHINLSRPYTAQLRDSQAAFAQAAHRTWMVNIDDLSLKSDWVHFTSETQQQLGYRFASIAAIPEPSTAWLWIGAGLMGGSARRTRRRIQAT
ncbi:MAG TPA: sialate O-acetylesterase [Pirellulaceae bacterium]|nr:sialate O-acetylesterase [Pirellulaceae bacterium]